MFITEMTREAIIAFLASLSENLMSAADYINYSDEDLQTELEMVAVAYGE